MAILLATIPVLRATSSPQQITDDSRSKLEPWLKEKVQTQAPAQQDKYIQVIIRATDNEAKQILAKSLETSPDIKKVRVLDALPVILAQAKPSAVNALVSNPYVKHIGDGETIAQTCLDTAAPTVGAPTARTVYGVDGTGITIAILDTGIDKTHPDLDDLDDDPNTSDPKVLAEVSFAYNSTGLEEPKDFNMHGTYCAGIAAGTGAASNGTYMGAAPKANLVNVKVMNNEGWGEIEWIINGINWAISHSYAYNIRVISMSLGAVYVNPEDDGSSELCQAVNDAVAAGLVVCVAQGNFLWGLDTEYQYGHPLWLGGGWYGLRPPASPGVASDVITVGGTDDKGTASIADDTMWRARVGYWDLVNRYTVLSRIGPTNMTSNPRTKPDVVAPACDITSCNYQWQTTGYYSTHSGTSAACPLVAGAVALMLQKYPELTPKQVKDGLKSTAELNNDLSNTYNGYQHGAENVRGSGLVNITDAISIYTRLTINAKDQYNSNVAYAQVSINGEFVGYSCKSYAVLKGSLSVGIEQIFWIGFGRTAYKYTFQHWEDGPTDNPRTLVVTGETTITAHYQKTYWPYPIPR